ncbi:MAG TPA: transcriptional repressor [Syntrophomonadaceae bacterium]|nr:transcriptional repressor [Syntrophomonadaceae bacterium]
MVLEELLEQLKKIGIRLTPQRQEIMLVLVERFQEGGPPLSADEITRHVRMRYPGISLDTVYRTLATFTKEGLVRELQFRDHSRRFELVRKGEHHHHLVCLSCGNIKKIPYCPEDCLERTRECYPEFEIKDHSFNVYGYCPKCRED